VKILPEFLPGPQVTIKDQLSTMFGCLDIPVGGRLYLNLTGGPRAGVVIRGDYELVTKGGWICIDYDDDGFLVGLEFHSGDPFGNKSLNKKSGYLQPKNPLADKKES
jgi:hypothetical protein